MSEPKALDPAERARLLGAILATLQGAVPGSCAEPRGSLAEGRADPYSDIDVLWEVPDALFPQAVQGLGGTLERVLPVESLRSDPLFQNSTKRRLIFARFHDVPLFWRLDLELFARSTQGDRSYDVQNPKARGGDWSLVESALMNAVAAIKAHLRGNDRGAGELLGRGYQRIGLEMPEQHLKDQILDLVEQATRRDQETSGLAGRIRALVEENFQKAEADND